MEISKKLSGSLMVANVIATILVIAIHYNSKGKIDISTGISINYLIQDFITNGLARVAVPFFALISGFFLYPKLVEISGFKGVLSNKKSTLLLPYIFASVLIYVSATAIQFVLNPEQPRDLSVLNVLFEMLVKPASTQLWFLRDLILLTLISPLFIQFIWSC